MRPSRRFRLIVLAPAVLALVLAACDKKENAPKPPEPPKDSTWNRPVHAQPAPQTAPTPTGPFADDASTVSSLRKGGYIIAFRHTRTDMNQKDEQGTNYDDCAKQRNLSEDGKNDAKRLAGAVQAIGFPIDKVLTSPFCRCKDTAQLIFGSFTIDNACMGEDEASVTSRARLLGTSVAEGKNLVLVTHRNSLTKNTGTDLEALTEGSALVILPKGDSKFEVVHTIKFEDWDRLAQAAANAK